MFDERNADLYAYCRRFEVTAVAYKLPEQYRGIDLTKCLQGLYDTSSHAFEVQIDTWRWVCLAARGADHLTFIGLFISLRIVRNIDLVDWAII